MTPTEWADHCIREYAKEAKVSRLPFSDAIMRKIIAAAVRDALASKIEQK